MSTDQTIEQEIQAKGLTAPRIKLEDIEAQIASEHFFRPGEAGMDALRFQFLTDDHADPEICTRVRELVKRLPVMSASAVRQDIDSMMAVPGGTLDPLNRLTFCVLVMRNGFTVVGKSAAVSPEGLDAEVGRNIARQDAINQCSPLLGYELRSKLASEKPAFKPYDHRCIKEWSTWRNPDAPGALLRARMIDGREYRISLPEGERDLLGRALAEINAEAEAEWKASNP